MPHMLTELFLLATLGTEPDSIRYNGRMGELEVSPPKLVDPGINVDGLLDEQAWSTAAILGGFTQYVPVEGVEPSDYECQSPGRLQIRLRFTTLLAPPAPNKSGRDSQSLHLLNCLC